MTTELDAPRRYPLPVGRLLLPDEEETLLYQVRQAVQESGLSRTVMAQRLHVSQAHLSRLLTGKRTMSLEWAQAILGLCGLELVVSVRPQTGDGR